MGFRNAKSILNSTQHELGDGPGRKIHELFSTSNIPESSASTSIEEEQEAGEDEEEEEASGVESAGRVKVTRDVYFSESPWKPTSSCADMVSRMHGPSGTPPDPFFCPAATSVLPTTLGATSILASRHHGMNLV
mmetsp:Transcript_66997/g.56878  ORF Transcript_66997/g.56878 Transcript_66997/m.56878 type:complete len:134 (+) Transcript_66997:394-795(+)